MPDDNALKAPDPKAEATARALVFLGVELAKGAAALTRRHPLLALGLAFGAGAALSRKR